MPKLETISEIKAGTITEPEPERDLRAENLKLVEDAGRNWYRLSKNLAESYDSEIWKHWSFPSFKDYCNIELHLEYRLAMWRVQMGRAIIKFGITEEMVSKLGGWTKFKEWTRLLTIEEIPRDKLLEALRGLQSLSFEQTKEYIESIIAEHRGGEDVQVVTMTFRLIGEGANVVKATLKDVKEFIDAENETQALEYMALDYGANRSNKLNQDFLGLAQKHREMAKKKKGAHKEHANKGKKQAEKKGKPVSKKAKAAKKKK